MKQHKEGTCKVSGRSVVLSAFYADFFLCSKLVIITILRVQTTNRFNQTIRMDKSIRNIVRNGARIVKADNFCDFLFVSLTKKAQICLCFNPVLPLMIDSHRKER